MVTGTIKILLNFHCISNSGEAARQEEFFVV